MASVCGQYWLHLGLCTLFFHISISCVKRLLGEKQKSVFFNIRAVIYHSKSSNCHYLIVYAQLPVMLSTYDVQGTDGESKGCDLFILKEFLCGEQTGMCRGAIVNAERVLACMLRQSGFRVGVTFAQFPGSWFALLPITALSIHSLWSSVGSCKVAVWFSPHT